MGSTSVALLLAIALAIAPNRAPLAIIPFAWTPGQIEVSVFVNDAPATFLLDTGAEYSVVSARLAARLQLPVETRGSHTFVDDVDLKVREIVLRHQRVMVMPFETYYERGRAIDGLLGYDLFSRFVVRIRFPQKDLTIWQPSAFVPPRAAVAVPLEFTGRLALVRALLKLSDARTLDARLMVDTAASQAIILRFPFSHDHGLLDFSRSTSIANSLASGARKVIDVPVEQVTISRWTFDRPRVEAFAEPVGSGASIDSDGLIGNELLSRFTLYVDYPHQHLLLEPVVRPGASRFRQ